MSPAAIIRQAKNSGLNALAVSDHNCCFNLPAFAQLCRREEMDCLYGIEVNTSEEVHILGLFDKLGTAMDFGEMVYDSLPDIANKPESMGDQPIVNEIDEIIGFAEKTLYGASSLNLHSLLQEIHRIGGLCVPSHIGRPSHSLISQLGFIPDEDFDAVELKEGDDRGLAGRFPVLRNSDSHYLESVGTVFNRFDLEDLTVENLRLFLNA